MDFKNKNAIIAIQPPAEDFKQNVIESGLNYERQFNKAIPGFIIVQPFVQEREIDNAIEEIQQNISFNAFTIETGLNIRKNCYKIEIGIVASEECRRKLDQLQIDVHRASGIKLEEASVENFIPLASFPTETLAQKKLVEMQPIWKDFGFAVDELIVFKKQLGKPFTATDKTISLVVDEDEQNELVMDGDWSNNPGDITDFSEFIDAATDAENRPAINTENISDAPLTVAHAETTSVLSTDVHEESVKVTRVKGTKSVVRARNTVNIADKSTRPTGNLGIAVDRVEKWILESVYPEKLPKNRNKLMSCIRPFCIVLVKPDVDKIIKELIEEDYLDPETRYFTPCPHMGKYEIKYYFPKADACKGLVQDFTTRNNTTFFKRHYEFTEHEEKILRQCRLIFSSEKAFEFSHKREGFIKKMHEMFETKEVVDPQRVIYRLIEEGLVDIDMDDNVTYYL